MDTVICRTCGGRGFVVLWNEVRQATEIETCPDCRGLGHSSGHSKSITFNEKKAKNALEAAVKAVENALKGKRNGT